MKSLVFLFALSFSIGAQAIMFGQVWKSDIRLITTQKLGDEDVIKVSYRGFVSCANKSALSAWMPSSMEIGPNGELTPSSVGVISRELIQVSVYVDKICVINAANAGEAKAELSIEKTVKNIFAENFQQSGMVYDLFAEHGLTLGILAQDREAEAHDSEMVQISALKIENFTASETVVFSAQP